MDYIDYSRKENLAFCLSKLGKLKVLFVKSGGGKNGPFKDIDNYVVTSLKELVKQVYPVSPYENITYYAKKYHPDLIVVLLGRHLRREQVISFTNLGITTALWTGDDPYIIDIMGETARYFDYVFTNELNCLPFYKNIGCNNVCYLPLGVFEKVFYPKHGQVPKLYQSDICFIGNAFSNRLQLLDEIIPYLSKRDVKLVGHFWNKLKNHSILAGKIRHAWISPKEAAMYYNGAKIVLNIHRAPDDKKFNMNETNIDADSINPRTFEISACQAFQLTDIRRDLNSFYMPEKEIGTFSSASELVEKIDYYLEHHKERKEIARNGYIKTYMKHRYKVRVTQLLIAVIDKKFRKEIKF